MSGKNELNPRTWNAVTIGIFLIAIALALIIYALTGSASYILCTLLLALGVIMIGMSTQKNNDNSGYGPSSKDTVTVGGVVLLALGIAGFVHIETHNLLITVAALILIIAATGILMAVKNRKV